MNLLQQIVARAKGRKQRIVLPEATEERTLRAADWVLADEVADIILIGNPEEIAGLAEQWAEALKTPGFIASYSLQSSYVFWA